MQRLGAAEHAGERLDRGADDVVERLLGGQRDAGGLRVEAHQPRLRVLRAVGVAHLARPDAAGGAVLGDLLEEVDLGVEEEAQARREVVDVHAAGQLLLDVGEAVLERERELLRGRAAGLADVVAGDRDRVPARHVARRPLHHVAEQAHRRVDREAPLLLGDVLLEDVGLDRAAELVGGDAALLGRDDVEREHHRRGGVDGHADRDLAEVDALRRGSPCRRACRSRRPRGRPRRGCAGCRSRGPSGSACRRRSRAPSARGRAGSGSARWSPPPCRSRRTAASSTGGRGTSTDRRRG